MARLREALGSSSRASAFELWARSSCQLDFSGSNSFYQLHAGLITNSEKRAFEFASIAYPYITLLVLYLAFEVLQAPFAIYLEQEQKIRNLTPRGPRVHLQNTYGNEPSISVTNVGEAADFWTTFDVNGRVPGERTGLFGRWAHTTSTKTRIVKGQTCRVLLGKLHTDTTHTDTIGRTVAAQWHVYSTNEDGTKDVPAEYTSLIGFPPFDGVAPDILLTGYVYADPDLIGGPQPWAIVLQAWGSTDNPA